MGFRAQGFLGLNGLGPIERIWVYVGILGLIGFRVQPRGAS